MRPLIVSPANCVTSCCSPAQPSEGPAVLPRRPHLLSQRPDLSRSGRAAAGLRDVSLRPDADGYLFLGSSEGAEARAGCSARSTAKRASISAADVLAVGVDVALRPPLLRLRAAAANAQTPPRARTRRRSIARRSSVSRRRARSSTTPTRSPSVGDRGALCSPRAGRWSTTSPNSPARAALRPARRAAPGVRAQRAESRAADRGPLQRFGAPGLSARAGPSPTAPARGAGIVFFFEGEPFGDPTVGAAEAR